MDPIERVRSRYLSALSGRRDQPAGIVRHTPRHNRERKPTDPPVRAQAVHKGC